MSAFKKIDVEQLDDRYSRYIDNNVKALAHAFNTAANLVPPNNDSIDPKIEATVEAAAKLFRDITGEKEPIHLNHAEQTHLMFEFMKIAAQLDEFTSPKDPALVKKVAANTNKILKEAVKQKLVVTPSGGGML